MTLDASKLQGLAEELKCSLCIELLQPPCARLSCCHYFCSDCLAQLMHSKAECPLCKVPAQRRHIRGDARIDRIAQLVAQLQALEEKQPDELVDLPALSPVAQPLLADRGSGGRHKRRARASNDSDDGSLAAPAAARGSTLAAGQHAARHGAEAGDGAEVKSSPCIPARQRLQLTASGRPHKRVCTMKPAAGGVGGASRPSAVAAERHRSSPAGSSESQDVAAAASADGQPADEQSPSALADDTRPDGAAGAWGSAGEAADAGDALPWDGAGDDRGDRPQPVAGHPVQTFKRQKRQPGNAQQQQQQQQRRPSARQQLREAARKHAAKRRADQAPKGMRAELDPYAFHSSGSQPSGAPAPVLVAPPAADGSPAAQPRTTQRAAAAAAERLRSAATPEAEPGAAVRGRGGGSGAAAAGRPASADSAPSSGRRIPGRLVPWSCAACTFENSASAHKCEVCDTARPTQRSPLAPPPSLERQPRSSPLPSQAESGGRQNGSSSSGGGGGGAAPRSSASAAAERPANPGGVLSSTPAAVPTAAAEPVGSGKKAAKPGAGMVLVPSGMTPDGKAALAAAARAIGARMAPKNKWCDAVTHVVCGAAANGTPKRTLSYLLGVLLGRWVVSSSWLPPPGTSGVAEEKDHEMPGGPQVGRGNRAAGGVPLLEGHEIHLAGQFSRKDDFARLVRAAGARLLKRPPAEDGSTTVANKRAVVATVCLYDEDTCSWGEGVPPAHVWHVSSKWLSDSAFAHTVQPLKQYIKEER